MSCLNLNLLFNFNNSIPVNISSNWQFGFQTPYSPIMEGIISFHDDLMIFLTFILFFVLYILYSCFSNFGSNFLPRQASFVHYPVLEIIWTIVPALILINLAIPSFSLLYSVDEIVEPSLTFKVVGHQWYWSYEIMTSNEILDSVFISSNRDVTIDSTSFDSYLIAAEDLDFSKNNHVRLLTVDNHLPLPTKVNIRALITSADVLHSWSIPSLGVKLDACPGRLNQTSMFIEREGFYYGQCSELCGVNHGFMPIGIISFNLYSPNLPENIAELLFLTVTNNSIAN